MRHRPARSSIGRVGVEWQGFDEVDPQCLETLRKILI